jgi:two-component system LytT family response regulator
VLIHAAGKRYWLRQTLGVLAELLQRYGVFRANRSVLVNVEFIQELRPMFKGNYTIVLKDGTHLTLTTGLRSLQRVAKFPTPVA